MIIIFYPCASNSLVRDGTNEKFLGLCSGSDTQRGAKQSLQRVHLIQFLYERNIQ